MTFSCEIWLGDAEKELGVYDFVVVPRCGETVSLPHEEEGKFCHYKVEQITHRAAGPNCPATTYLFVLLVEPDPDRTKRRR